MSQQLDLVADSSRGTGTGPAGRLRREGKIPAVLYGLGAEPVAVAVPWRELRQCLITEAGTNAIINLDVDGAKHLSMVKEIQRHPVRREVIHVDFIRVDPAKPVTVEVPVALTGEAKKVAAMQGMVVVPIFAGFDLAGGAGRLWDYDPTGGRYEEKEYVATGSGSLHAGTVVKVGWRSTLDSEAAIKLAVKSLWEAADADSATGGPDALRGIYPVVATITSSGWARLDDTYLAVIVDELLEEQRTRNGVAK